MKNIFILFILLFSFSTFAASSSTEVVKKVFEAFQQGQYETVVSVLDKLQKRVDSNSKRGKEIQGLIYYWKGMSFARLNEFDQAEKYFQEAIKLNYDSADIYYEYGQVLYVAEKYKRARIAFKKSVKHKYKVGVSLYYIGFISQELKEYKKAVSFYNLIEKLPKEEKDQVVQAARMQIGDVYLAQVERQPDVYNGVKDYVIPQYKKALAWNEDSALAGQIKTKIEKLQRKYELILFRMRNGRLTARPPYFLRANALYGINDNITTLSDSDKSGTSKEDYSSAYYSAGAFARYSFYPSSSFSYAPEFTASYTKYLSDSDSIKPYNTYYYTAALKTNYEFIYNDAPATIFTDFDYTYNADDADADDEFAEASQVTGVQLSTQLEFSKNNPTTLRFRYALTDAVTDTSDYSTVSFGYEQIYLTKHITFFLFSQYAMNTYSDSDSEASNNNAFTLRLDSIVASIEALTPTFYVSLTNTDYVDDSDRAATNLTTLGLNLSRKISKKWYATLDYSTGSQVGDDDDTYNQMITTFNIDYIY